MGAVLGFLHPVARGVLRRGLKFQTCTNTLNNFFNNSGNFWVPPRTSILILFSYFRRLQTFKKRILASSFVSVHLWFFPHGTSRLPLDGFAWNFIFYVFLKTCREIMQVSLPSEKVKDSSLEDVCKFTLMSRWILLKMRSFWDKVVEKIKTRISCLVIFFRKSCRLWDNVGKYG